MFDSESVWAMLAAVVIILLAAYFLADITPIELIDSLAGIIALVKGV